MGELQTAVDTFPIWKAVLWIFYRMAALVMVELLLRGFDEDDDPIVCYYDQTPISDPFYRHHVEVIDGAN